MTVAHMNTTTLADETEPDIFACRLTVGNTTSSTLFVTGIIIIIS